MTEREMIHKILEEYSPITKVDIAKRIYNDFNGYKCQAWKVKKHLWDKAYFSKIVVYDKNNYTYSLKGKIEERKVILSKSLSHFNFKINHKNKLIGSNRFIEYSVKGKEVTIESYVGKENLDLLIQAIVMVQMESGANDNTVAKFMNRLNSKLVDLF